MRNGAQGFEQLPARARRRQRRAAFIQAATVFELLIFIVAEEVGRADRAEGARCRLRFVVKIGKGEIAQLCELRHILEGVFGIAYGVIGANCCETNAFRYQSPRVGNEPVDH